MIMRKVRTRAMIIIIMIVNHCNPNKKGKLRAAVTFLKTMSKHSIKTQNKEYYSAFVNF